MWDLLEKGLSSQFGRLLDLLFDVHEVPVKEGVAKKLDKVFTVIGNFIFLIITTVAIISLILSFLSDEVRDKISWFVSQGAVAAIPAGVVLLLFLFIVNIAFWVRKYVQVYKLTAVYALAEIIFAVFASGDGTAEGSIMGKMVGLVGDTFFL
jgi:hypothetical protein